MKKLNYRVKVRVIYSDRYKNLDAYDDAIGRAVANGYDEVLESTGWGNHGGYCILAKEVDEPSAQTRQICAG